MPLTHELTTDRIERHIAKMGGQPQYCEAHNGEFPATVVIDGIPLCEVHRDS